MLTASEIAGARLQVASVDCPEWGGEVFVRSMRASELHVFQAMAAKVAPDDEAEGTLNEDQIEAMAQLVSFLLCDSSGVKIGDDEFIDAILDKPIAPMQRCMEAAMELNGLGDDAVDDAEKN